MKIANKISLSFLIPAVILANITAAISYTIIRSDLKNAIFAHLSVIAQSKAHHVEMFLEEHKNHVRLLSKLKPIKSIFSSGQNIENLNKILRAIEEEDDDEHGDIYELFVINPEGIIVASTDKEDLGKDKSSYIDISKAKEKVYIKDVHVSKHSGRGAIDISAPIIDMETKRLLGILVVGVEMNKLDKITIDRTGDRTSLGKTGETYLVNKDGFMITPSRFIKDTFLKQKVDTLNVKKCLLHKNKKYMPEEEEEIVISPDYRGVNVLGTHEYIPQMKWCLLAKIDEKEGLAPLVRLRTIFVVIMLFIPIAAWLTGSFLSRFITKPIHKLHKGTEIIGRGNLNYKVGTDEKDEIGQLSRAFDEMTRELKEKTTSVANLNKEIAERKKMEEALAQQAQELARSNTELQHFAYVASHDLQEPLRMVSSYVQLLARRYKGKLDTDADEFIGYAMDGAERMHRLINDILTLSRVSTRGKPFKLTDCETILKQALTNLQTAIKENKATVTHDSLPEVMADDIQLAQLFQNLIGNAIKFHGDDLPRVHISAKKEKDYWVFSVRDNGIGIEQKYKDKIFLIFQRVHSRVEYPGTGIGLTVCKKIVERRGGRMWVESEPGKGSTFYFSIPLKN